MQCAMRSTERNDAMMPDAQSAWQSQSDDDYGLRYSTGSGFAAAPGASALGIIVGRIYSSTLCVTFVGPRPRSSSRIRFCIGHRRDSGGISSIGARARNSRQSPPPHNVKGQSPRLFLPEVHEVNIVTLIRAFFVESHQPLACRLPRLIPPAARAGPAVKCASQRSSWAPAC